jgi:hypothetical protein
MVRVMTVVVPDGGDPAALRGTRCFLLFSTHCQIVARFLALPVPRSGRPARRWLIDVSFASSGFGAQRA